MTSLEIHNESGERLDHVFTPGQEDAQAAGRKVVVVGGGKDGLPLILGGGGK